MSVNYKNSLLTNSTSGNMIYGTTTKQEKEKAKNDYLKNNLNETNSNNSNNSNKN